MKMTNSSIHGPHKVMKPQMTQTLLLVNQSPKHHLQKNGPNTALLIGHTETGALHVSWEDLKMIPIVEIKLVKVKSQLYP